MKKISLQLFQHELKLKKREVEWKHDAPGMDCIILSFLCSFYLENIAVFRLFERSVNKFSNIPGLSLTSAMKNGYSE